MLDAVGLAVGGAGALLAKGITGVDGSARAGGDGGLLSVVNAFGSGEVVDVSEYAIRRHERALDLW